MSTIKAPNRPKKSRRSIWFRTICRLEFQLVEKFYEKRGDFLASEGHGDVPMTWELANWYALKFRRDLEEYKELERQLRIVLCEMGWKGTPLPQDIEDWPVWWTEVRKYASQFRSGEHRFKYTGYVDRHNLD